MSRALAVASLALGLSFSSCKSCSRASLPPDAGRGAPFPPLAPADFPPPPSTWRFQAARGPQNIALPSGCALRAPITTAPVGSPVRYLAEPHTLAHLILAEASGDPPRITGAGVVAVEPEGISHDPVRIPWVTPVAMPRLARAKNGAYVAGVDRPADLAGDATGVALWRGETTEDLGEGDAFETVDMACGEDRCALLTSRRAATQAPGAEVWIGRPTEPASAWKNVVIGPTRQGALSDAHGFGIARVDALGSDTARAPLLAPSVVVTLFEIGEVVFFGVGDGEGATEMARMPAPYGAIDAIALPTPMALVYASPLDDDGCGHEGGHMQLVRQGREAVPLEAPMPPLAGSIRRLGKGYLASWIAPLGCHETRHVVYAVVLDPLGSPISDVVAVGDGTTYAVAATGADVDMWVQYQGFVRWIRARCESP